MKIYKIMNVCLAILLSGILNAPAIAHNGEEHGNHDAQHGGFVLMYIDLHFEIVMLEEGGAQLYYSNAIREALPAATVSDVTLSIENSDQSIDTYIMGVSKAGDYWEGSGKPLSDPQATVSIGFVFQGEPLVFNLPARFIPAPETMSDMSGMTASGSHAGH